MQAIGLVARFEDDPRESHVMAIKRIFRYLKGTVEYGILEIKISLFMHIQMQIGQEMWMTGRAPVVEHSSWERDWFLG